MVNQSIVELGVLEWSARTADAPKQMGESARTRPHVKLHRFLGCMQLDTYESEAFETFRGVDLSESISKTGIEVRASLWVKNKKHSVS